MSARPSVRQLRAALALVGWALAPCGGPAQSQPIAYPVAPVRIIVPFPAGGSTDIVARVTAAQVSALWNAQVIVENRSGASGLIGSAEGARAPADGYTLTMGNTQTHGMNAALFPNPRFDALRDIQPIAMIATTRNVLAVSSASPIQSVPALLESGRTRALSYASVGQGSTSHLIGDYLSRRYGLNATHVPYRGASPAITDLVAGQVSFMAGTYGSLAGFHRTGKVRVLALAAETRDERIPEVPTFAQAGLVNPGLNTSTSLFAPAGTAREIAQKWSDALAQIVTRPDFIDTLARNGFELQFRPLDEFEPFYARELPRLEAIIREANIRLE